MSNNWQPSFLENDLIKLVPLQEDHFDTLYQVASDPLIWEQHPANNRYQKEVFRDFFDKALEEKKAFLILDKLTNRTVGSTRYYDFDPDDSGIAIGFTFLSRDYWGGKTNRIIKTLMLDHAFQTVEKVYFHIGEKNIRSQTAIKRLGAELFTELITLEHGAPIRKLKFMITRNDWKNRNN